VIEREDHQDGLLHIVHPQACYRATRRHISRVRGVRRTATGDDPGRMAALRDHVLEMAVRDFGASFCGEHGIGRANQAVYDELTPAVVQKYSAAIAAVFARVPSASVRFGPPEREARDLND
jgi:hypothetical protein